ncbi:VOC family protein [Ornithinimicrobium cavernae]|uniref:VOC family protein n=1 Tax=Ornithinimicrobium cavernae TaxID=2666047 RepID=UPI000D69F21B|nr:VOC family protein [Ornithinimicrobium cavernae]
MATRLNPYLSFPGNAREALEFYAGILGGELDVSTFGEFPGAGPELDDKIMHGQLETAAGLTLMAADIPPGTDHQPGNNITISLSGDDVETLRGYWAGLSEGATVQTPLEVQMWGDEFGQLTDRFGISWLVNISGQAAEAAPDR